MIPAVMPTYSRPDVAFASGQGAYLVSETGRRYLDFAGGIAVTSLGHCHPHLVAAINDQAGKLWHTSNLFRIPGQERLAERLIAATFADTAFFTNSGVEAWECGVKVCRKHMSATGRPERWRIITVGGAFHGRTLSAIAAAKSQKLVEGFGPIVDGYDQVAFGNLNELRMAITDETAAICVEPIIGEGGIKSHPFEYLKALRMIADEFGILLFFDEIQSGMGRTGKLFAHEWSGIAPDVMCVAKGIGGGFPLGACLATEKAAVGMTPGTHGSTFGGNPLAMAVGNAVLDVLLEDGFFDRVCHVAEDLHTKLSALVTDFPSVFSELRGQGLMLGLACQPPVGDVVTVLREEGMLAVPAAENVMRLLPPLIIESDQVDEAVKCLRAVAQGWRPGHA